MLTLSVRTARGPTSIRIQYSSAQFLLDSSSPARPSLSSFPNVPSLVQYYMGPKRKAEEGKVEEEEKAPSKPLEQTIQDTSVLLKLKRAVYKPQSLPSLQHLTRLVINRHSDCPDQLPLPRPLLRYIQDYPFKIWSAPSSLLFWQNLDSVDVKQSCACEQPVIKTGHGVMSLVTTYLKIQIVTCLISDFICRGMKWWNMPVKDDLRASFSTVIYTLEWMWKFPCTNKSRSVLDIHTAPTKYTDSTETSFTPFIFSQ